MNLNSLATLTLALSLSLSLASGSFAQINHDDRTLPLTSQFQRLEQPLWAKVAVTSAGLGLIGLELWWFLLSQPRSGQARPRADRQGVRR
jgi:plastocyanin domain-containing protein